VEVSADKAVIEGRGARNASVSVDLRDEVYGLSLFSDSPFTATLERSASGRGFHYVIKDARGNVTTDDIAFDPKTTGRGEIVFREGKPSPQPDGVYVIGEFRPETGKPEPISVHLIDSNMMYKAPPPALKPTRVTVSANKAIIAGGGSTNIAFKICVSNGNVWDTRLPSNSPFIATVERSASGSDIDCVIKDSQGKTITLDHKKVGRLMPGQGQVVFREGMPSRELDGSYAIAEFRLESGGTPGLIFIRLEALDAEAAPPATEPPAKVPVLARVAVSANGAVFEGSGSPEAWFSVKVHEKAWDFGFLNNSAFTVTIGRSTSAQDIRCEVKDSLDNVNVYDSLDLLTKERGQIVFHESTAPPEPDGSYVIGEFRPESGGTPWPIRVRFQGFKALAPPVAEPPTTGPGITRVTASAGMAVIEGRGSKDTVMGVLFRGTFKCRGLFNDPPFTAFTLTVERSASGRGVHCVLKDTRGNVATDISSDPTTTGRGEIVFREGRIWPNEFGQYVIGEFRPETGMPEWISFDFRDMSPHEQAKLALKPARVTVSADKAVIEGRGSTEACFAIISGIAWNVSTFPSDSEFTATIERSASGNSLKCVIKDSRGNVRVRDSSDPELAIKLSQIVFHEGTPPPEPDGSYIIGEFRRKPGGKPQPIRIRMEKLQ
jgi:hypothetical protein